LFRSSDGGAGWRTAGHGRDLAYGTVVTDPQVSTTLYGAGSSGGIVKSLDGGRTWVASNAGLVSTFVDALVLVPGSSKTLYAGTWQGVFSTTDGGLNWLRTNSGLGNKSVIAFAVSPQSPRAIYAGTRGYGIFKSTNGGLNWRRVNHGLPVKVVEGIAVDPRNPSTVYAGASKTSLGVHRLFPRLEPLREFGRKRACPNRVRRSRQSAVRRSYGRTRSIPVQTAVAFSLKRDMRTRSRECGFLPRLVHQ
jgi:hypothetical protein